MQYRKLGYSGLSVSPLCLGTMQFGWTADEETSLKLLDTAFNEGINFIDTANIYSRWVDGNPGGVSESILGTWFQRHPSRREKVVLATKVRGPMGEAPMQQGLSRKHIFSAVRDSLDRMKTSYIDLYQLHWPDDETPIEETLEALTHLVEKGWIHHIGCSNFTAWRLVEALLTSEMKGYVAFVSLQPHYNLVHRKEYEHELEQVCQKYDLGVIPYSPLARGFLTGKYPLDGTPPADKQKVSGRILEYLQDPMKCDVLEEVSRVSKSLNCSPSQISLAWLLAKESVTSPIIGPRTSEQLRDNLGALEIGLPEDILGKLDAISAWSD